MSINTILPDVDKILTTELRRLMRPAWPDLYIGRSVPATVKPFMVTLRMAGGPELNEMTDQIQLAINVFAPTEGSANQLALTVASWLRSIRVHPVIRVSVTAPSDVSDSPSEQERYMTAVARVRRLPTA